MAVIMIQLGIMIIPFERNFQIAKANFLSGRPIFENQEPAISIPDPPQWLCLKSSDE